jgi:hypothetical protein
MDNFSQKFKDYISNLEESVLTYDHVKNFFKEFNEKNPFNKEKK